MLSLRVAPPAIGTVRRSGSTAPQRTDPRLAHSEGPQHVTLHGRDAVVVIDADEFLRLKGERTGQLLIDALQASPHREIEIEPRRSVMPVRDITL
jgi:PHD/YefM family antitoxin component YafN of YafNO toxin-antitoxin module